MSTCIWTTYPLGSVPGGVTLGRTTFSITSLIGGVLGPVDTKGSSARLGKQQEGKAGTHPSRQTLVSGKKLVLPARMRSGCPIFPDRSGPGPSGIIGPAGKNRKREQLGRIRPGKPWFSGKRHFCLHGCIPAVPFCPGRPGPGSFGILCPRAWQGARRLCGVGARASGRLRRCGPSPVRFIGALLPSTPPRSLNRTLKHVGCRRQGS